MLIGRKIVSGELGSSWHAAGGLRCATACMSAAIAQSGLNNFSGLRTFSPHVLSGTLRSFANVPDAAVYSGPVSPSSVKRFTLRQLRSKYAAGKPISMLTAYDYPSAVHVEQAGVDLLLVGDSAAMVVHGHDTTLPITMDEMLFHARAVSRGARRPLLVADLPFGSYETGPEAAVTSAVRMMKEGGMDAVKLEGGGPVRIRGVQAVVDAGIAVMGHTGLMPQTISVMGGFRPQAQSADSAFSVLRDAKALEAAGCFAVILECVPSAVASAVTAELSIPTIGIGAGGGCSGQVLVYHDVLGMMQHPHHAKVTPKFCKQYGAVGEVVQQALVRYREDVETGQFPSAEFSPYQIADKERSSLIERARAAGFEAAAQELETD